MQKIQLFKIYFIIFFKILSFSMTFGHPTGAWPECDPRLNGTLPMDLSVGLSTIKNRDI